MNQRKLRSIRICLDLNLIYKTRTISLNKVDKTMHQNNPEILYINIGVRT